MCPIGLEPQSELVTSEVINRKLVKHAVIVLESALMVEYAYRVVASENLAMCLQSAQLDTGIDVRGERLFPQRGRSSRV